MIGRYRLLQPIGEGGMGTVWMAEQSEPVLRNVALKLCDLGISPATSDRDWAYARAWLQVRLGARCRTRSSDEG
jgi:hypothetical protein